MSKSQLLLNRLDALTMSDSPNTMSALEPSDVQEICSVLKQRTQFYLEETARMENLFRKLKLFGPCTDMLDKLTEVQEKLKIDDLSTNSAALSYAHNIRKQKHYVAKLKICTKLYITLNSKLEDHIKKVKLEVTQSKNSVNQLVTMTVEELKTMEEKIKRYEHEVVKLQKKYPWLQNAEFDLPNISKEMTALDNLKQQKDKLLDELKHFHGLKPDLTEATNQLATIKSEYQEISDKLVRISD